MIKILLLTSTWDNAYCGELISGIQERIESYKFEVRLDVYNVYDETLKDSKFYKQLELFSLPNFDEYDGMMLSISSSEFLEEVDKARKKFEALGKPIVTTDQSFGDVPFCGIDNYKAMYSLVEHVITQHGAKTLNYVGGPKGYEEDNLRYSAYVDCCRAHGLEVNPERELHFSFLTKDGNKAYNQFKEKGYHLADAIICANDHMAVGYCDEAKKDGYVCPKDFIVTGFDNVEIGQTYMPSITSINRDRRSDGREAIDFLIKRISGDMDCVPATTVGYIVENESCGCNKNRALEAEYSELLNLKRIIIGIEHSHDYARQKLCSSNSFDQFQEAMQYGCEALNLDPFVICISQSFFEGRYNEEQKYYTDEMNYYTKDYKGVIIRSKEGIIPDRWHKENKSGIMVISPLVFGKHTQGYMVTPWNEFHFTNGSHRTYLESLSLALDIIGQRITLDGMNQKLQKLYVKDSLTDLYNRFGYASLSNGFFEKHFGNVYIMFMDLDKLKHINDFYGHAMGDIAIKCAAQAIRECFPDTDIHVRMGGDEYLVMGSYLSEEELFDREMKVLKVLERLSKENNLPVKLEASMGHVVNKGFDTGLNLEALVSMADKRMYSIKQGKKRQ